MLIMVSAKPGAGGAAGRRKISGLAWVVLGGWSMLCLAVFLWWATAYRSLVAWFGEWQFDWLGRYFPSVTITIAVLVLTVPLAGLGWLVRWRWRRNGADMAAGGGADPLDGAILSARRARLFFGVLSGALALAALLAYFAAGDLPDDKGAVRVVALSGAGPVVEGHARFATVGRYGRIARLDENVGFAARTMFIAPVYATGSRERARFFVEMLPASKSANFVPLHSGVLVRHGLPPELSALYRRIGVPIADDSYMLMRDGERPRWRLMALAVQGAIIALIALLISEFFRRQINRLRKASQEILA